MQFGIARCLSRRWFHRRAIARETSSVNKVPATRDPRASDAGRCRRCALIADAHEARTLGAAVRGLAHPQVAKWRSQVAIAADADHLLVYALDSEIKDVPEGGRLLLWSRREPERQWGADFVGMIKKAELRPDGTLVVAHTSPGCSTGGIGATVDELVRPASGGRALALAKRAHRCISGVPMVFDLSAREPIAPPPLGSRAGRAVRSEA